MRKLHYVIFSIALIVSQYLFCQAPVLVSEFPSASVYSGINIVRDGRAPNPKILYAASDGFVIWSFFGSKLLVLDSKGNLMYEIHLESSEDYSSDAQWSQGYDPYILYTDSNRNILILNESHVFGWDGKLLTEIPYFFERDCYERFYPVFGYLFYYTNEGVFDSVKLKYDVSKNQLYLQGNAATEALFLPGSTWQHPGLDLDIKNRLILNGQIMTRDWETFIDWYLEIFPSIKRSGNASNIGITDQGNSIVWKKGINFDPQMLKRIGSYDFQGRDAAGNWYWGGGLVFSPYGEIIKNNMVIDPDYIPNDDGYGLGSFIHPNGDVYALYFEKGMVYLSKTENTWSPEAKKAYQEGLKQGLYKLPEAPTTAYRAPYGTILEDGVRVRWNPNTDPRTGVNTNLKKGTSVQILARTETKETIDGIEAYWYAVKTSDGVYGWSFGGYITVAAPDKVMVGSGYFGPY